jgi:hypothetical protein
MSPKPAKMPVSPFTREHSCCFTSTVSIVRPVPARRWNWATGSAERGLAKLCLPGSAASACGGDALLEDLIAASSHPVKLDRQFAGRLLRHLAGGKAWSQGDSGQSVRGLSRQAGGDGRADPEELAQRRGICVQRRACRGVESLCGDGDQSPGALSVAGRNRRQRAGLPRGGGVLRAAPSRSCWKAAITVFPASANTFPPFWLFDFNFDAASTGMRVAIHVCSLRRRRRYQGRHHPGRQRQFAADRIPARQARQAEGGACAAALCRRRRRRR